MSDTKIVCPHCNEVFSIDEAKYESIVKQIRDKEFKAALAKEEKNFEEKKASAVAIAEEKIEKKFLTQIAELNNKLTIAESSKEQAEKSIATQLELKESEYQNKLNEKNTQIQNLTNQIELNNKDLQAAIQEAVNKKELDLKDKLSEKDQKILELSNQIELNKETATANLAQALSKQKDEIAKLKSQIAIAAEEQKALKESIELKIENAIQISEKNFVKQLSEKEQIINTLQSQQVQEKSNFASQINQLKDFHKQELDMRDQVIESLKDLKNKLSVKLLGESLEQHCEKTFNSIRMTAFPQAYFGKDNDISKTNTKGDYIYRDYHDGIEYISIMFEMKNEADTSVNKQTNDSFFAKLDKDRKAKNCEYAVLVSLLEKDNEYYNQGIVDVSYEGYEKMYVIRPQFFIPLITMLRNANLKTVNYRKELEIIKSENADVVDFEAQLTTLKENISKKYEAANKTNAEAIKQIDNAIRNLCKVREQIKKTDDNERLAANKLNEFTIQKAIKNNPTMVKKFEEVGYDAKAEQKFPQYSKYDFGQPPREIHKDDEEAVVEIDEE